jgi:hypothetical protein
VLIELDHLYRKAERKGVGDDDAEKAKVRRY